MSFRQKVYYSGDTGNMYVSNRYITGALERVNAIGTCDPSENDRIWSVAWVTPAQQTFVDGGFLFDGCIIERHEHMLPETDEQILAAAALKNHTH